MWSERSNNSSIWSCNLVVDHSDSEVSRVRGDVHKRRTVGAASVMIPSRATLIIVLVGLLLIALACYWIICCAVSVIPYH
jgi:hypothetical protein